ncbi:MAG: glucose-1-phosphate cytidylyltransferase [Actinomycetes bacterium]
MKAVILAGGRGTRLSEEAGLRPKTLVEIGGRPILWHIMSIYSQFGVNDFIVCCGYKGHMIRDYFLQYYANTADLTVDLGTNSVQYHHVPAEPWRITMVDTGLDTQTGGRLRRIRDYVGDDTFMMTYGDAVADVDIDALLAFHAQHKTWATVTAVVPRGRFGALEVDDWQVVEFREKPAGDKQLINGGFFVLEPAVFDLIEGDQTLWELEPLESLADQGQLSAFEHHGYWQCMDTLRDRDELEKHVETGAPWLKG